MPVERKDVLELDGADPLRHIRSQFQLPSGIIYLDGNSLGPLPAATPGRLAHAIAVEWGKDLIGSWNRHDWIGAPQRVGAMIAPLVGAKPNEVIVADSTSVNLFKLLSAAIGWQPGRSGILTERGNFPTDLYIAGGVAPLFPGRRIHTIDGDAIINAIDEDTAVVLLTHVHYKTGRKLDIRTITEAAHARGALVLWDLSHSVGALALDLDECAVDLAVGCGYKYLNGGPGAPAFLFVAEHLQGKLRSPLSGWMGHAEPFEFRDDYVPANGILRFLCGTPPILGIIALEQGLAMFNMVDRFALFAKAQALCSLFVDLIDEQCSGFGLEVITPRDPSRRGSHISVVHPDAHSLCQALIRQGVIGDFRSPDVLRFGFAPLYTSFMDVWRAVELLAHVLETRCWDREEYRVRLAVT